MSAVKDAIKGRSKSKDKLLTPLLYQFMIENELFQFDDRALRLAKKILESERQERKSDVFHPSSSAACMRAQVLQYIGYKPQKEESLQLLSIFDDGKWRHLRWHLILYRMKISARVEPYVSGNMQRVGGSPDQILNLSKHYPWLSGIRVGFEMKGINSGEYSKLVRNNRPKMDHLYQIVTYMVLSDIEIYTLIYENKNTQEWYEFDITTNKKYAKKLGQNLYLPDLWVRYIMARYHYMNRSVDKNVLPSFECTLKTDDAKFNRCSMKKHCLAIKKSGKIRVTKPFHRLEEVQDRLWKISVIKNKETHFKRRVKNA